MRIVNGFWTDWKAYLQLCKLRVVALMLLTVMIGMLLASAEPVSLEIFTFAVLGIGLTASSGAVINHFFDRYTDSIMHRTKYRPLPTGALKPRQAIIFAGILALLGLLILIYFVNLLTALLTLLTFIGYAGIYTLYLKHTTPQNIVIGGLAGAMPPLLGWTAVSGQIDPRSLLLVLIIFVWTPPHFWALAIHRFDEYAKANIPMLPVTHGIPYTKLSILLYTILLVAISLLPFASGMSGWIYLMAALFLGVGFLYYTLILKYTAQPLAAIKTFRYSIFYLIMLFLFLLLDHYLMWR